MTPMAVTSYDGTVVMVEYASADDHDAPGYIAQFEFIYPDGDLENVTVYTTRADRNDDVPEWGASVIYPWTRGLPDVGFYHDRFEQYADTRANAALAAALACPTELPYDDRGMEYEDDGNYGDDYRPIGGQIGG